MLKRYIIEREIPGAHNLTPAELQGIAERSNNVLRTLGPQIQWIQSYVSENKITCVYLAENEQLLREHASRGGFPATRVAEIVNVIDPTTANQRPAAV
ncbi:MAG TPA: DUF4242 domain-containing protein [Vicinamibacterales bacterium]|nr:DUF4242 domain-containing protein [Vicinamibacterales bacterium]